MCEKEHFAKMTQQHEISKSKQHSAETTLPFLMDYLPDIFRKKAEEELNETSENRVESLKDMKEIIKADKILKDIEFADDYLIQFLRHSKYNVRRAISRLQNCIVFRRKYDYYNSVPMEEMLGLKSGKILTILPMRTPGGCTLIHFQYGYLDPEEMSLDDFGRILCMLFQQSLRDPMTQINGYITINDLKNVSFKALRQLTPYYMYLVCHSFLDCIPGRYKEAHLVNVPVTFRIIWKVFKTFIPEKIKNRVFFHSSPEELLEYLPRSVLPSKYGGDLEDNTMTDWILKASAEFRKCPMGGQPNYY